MYPIFFQLSSIARLYGSGHGGCAFPQSADAAVHQVAHALVVDAHDAADVIVFALLHVVEVDDLSLAWREFLEELFHVGCQCRLPFHPLRVELFVFRFDAHAAVVNLVVAEVYVASIFVVDAVAQRDVEVALNVLHVSEVVSFEVKFDEDIVYAVLEQLTVGGEARAESKQVVYVLVIKICKVDHG